MKDKILKIGRISKNKFTENELNKIFKLTHFLSKNASLSERCYYIINEIKEQKKCLNCGNVTKFLRIGSGHRTYCSNSCKNKHLIETTNIKDKIANSSKKAYYNFSKEELKNQQNKRIKTMIKRNIISDPKDRKDFYNYIRLVWRITNENDLSKLKNIEKRGRSEIKNSFQLDHKFSISEGFRQNILPYYIGNINNLEMILSIKNSSKKGKCSITLNELFNVRNDILN